MHEKITTVLNTISGESASDRPVAVIVPSESQLSRTSNSAERCETRHFVSAGTEATRYRVGNDTLIVLAADREDDDALCRDLGERIRVLGQVDADAVARVQASDLISNSRWIRLAGHPQTQLCDTQHWSLRHRVQIARSVVEALRRCHQMGIHHGGLCESAIEALHRSEGAAGGPVPWLNLLGVDDGAEAAAAASRHRSFSASHPLAAEQADVEALSDWLRRWLRPLAAASEARDESDWPARLRARWSHGLRSDAIIGLDDWERWLTESVPESWQATGESSASAPKTSSIPHDGTAERNVSMAANVVAQPSTLDDETVEKPFDAVASADPFDPAEDQTTEHSGQCGDLPAPAVPERLGRYRVGQLVGQGGMGTVYRGTDELTGETVAIKVLRPRGDIAQAVRRFRKEARLLAEVQNDHVTRLHHIGSHADLHFMVMEFVEGISLKEFLSHRDSSSESSSLRLIAELAAALVDAHESGIVHRDIKPENILLQTTADGMRGRADADSDRFDLERSRLKLSDFGIARHIDQSASMEVTAAGSILGTPRYMSPEQCMADGSVTPATDVYAIGITVFELLAGRVPFDADDPMKLAAMHCFDEPPSLRRFNPDVSDATVALVHRCLQKAPEKRFADAADLLESIQRLLRGTPSDAESHPPLPPHDPDRLFRKAVSWELQSAAADLWPLVSDTQRINHALNLPAVDYELKRDETALRKLGSFRIGGVQVGWEEFPFEWIEGERMGVLRHFHTGPLEWFMNVVSVEPSDNGGTRLTHEVRIQWRNLIGRALSKVEADWKGFRKLETLYRRLDRSLQGRHRELDEARRSDECVDPFVDSPRLSSAVRSRLDAGRDQLIDAGILPEVADRLVDHLGHASAVTLSRLRPIELAHQWGQPDDQVIDAMIVAAQNGWLTIRWEVLCPRCRVSASEALNLRDIKEHTDCVACDAAFRSDLASAIELVFRPHHDIRAVDDAEYCTGGPAAAPHVIAQLRLAAGECLDFATELTPGVYQIRWPDSRSTRSIEVRDVGGRRSCESRYPDMADDRDAHAAIGVRSGRVRFRLQNESSGFAMVRLERCVRRDDCLTAAIATAIPRFRTVFPDQLVDSDATVRTDRMSILCTDIAEIDDAESNWGEARVYRRIRELSDAIASIARRHRGTVVKSVGHRLQMVFAASSDAAEASREIHRVANAMPPDSLGRPAGQRAASSDDGENSPETLRDTAMSSENLPLSVGVALHRGPLLIVSANDRFDYVGGTVRSVERLAADAGSGLVWSSSVYEEPGVATQYAEFIDRGRAVVSGSPPMSTLRWTDA